MLKSIPSTDGGIAVLGHLFVGFLGSAAGGLLDGLGNVVGTLLDRFHCDGMDFFKVVVSKENRNTVALGLL